MVKVTIGGVRLVKWAEVLRVVARVVSKSGRGSGGVSWVVVTVKCTRRSMVKVMTGEGMAKELGVIEGSARLKSTSTSNQGNYAWSYVIHGQRATYLRVKVILGEVMLAKSVEGMEEVACVLSV
jgi:hypothetical protein